ncbi:alpha/beta hydrolase [Peribacillus asahii]|uniref:alpha/beta hydrolase n=1 Tax=Peribacillus asahii TaxID=228899 RepID=UPI003809CAC2
MQTSMIYELRKPKQVEPGKTYPALFLMHGMGSNEQDLLSLTGGLENSCYIFSIRGHLTQPPGYAFFTIEGFGRPHRSVFDDAVKRITNFIDYACDKYPIDRSQLYLLGFSQGAILSMTLGLTLGDHIKGIVALSGYIPEFVKNEYSIQSVKQLSIFISHGEFDQVLPFEWGKANDAYFKQLGANVAFHAYPEGHTVSQQNYQDFMQWLHHELGNKEA